MYVGSGSQEAGAFVRSAISQICGLLFVGLLVQVVGGFVVLASFGVFSFLKSDLALSAAPIGRVTATTSNAIAAGRIRRVFTGPSQAVFPRGSANDPGLGR
jgi:hypothetical protein